MKHNMKDAPNGRRVSVSHGGYRGDGIPPDSDTYYSGRCRSNISIKWNIFGYLIGLCVLLLVILWLFQTVFLGGFYRNIRLAALRDEAGALAELVRESDIPALWNPGDVWRVQSSGVFPALLQAVNDQGDMQLELWSENVGSFVITGNEWEGGGNRFGRTPSQYTVDQKRQLRDEAALDGASAYHFARDDAGREYVLSATLIPGHFENILLLCSAGLTPVGAAVGALRVQLVYISVIMLVLAGVLALLIARRVSRPIERLNAAAGELGRGNYAAGFESAGYREISELTATLRQAAGELGKTDRLRRELVANVSHDLRTPLTLITGYSEMIRDLPDENTPENMQVIIDESLRLQSLVTGLLDLSRLESGTAEMQVCAFDLTGETGSVIGRFSKFCADEGYTIRFEHEDPVTVAADPARLMQVVYNYISNAITHTGADKLVTVRQIVTGKRVTVTVTDTGPGIPPEELPYIWDRYYKGNAAHKRGKIGTGLGLSIVKSILSRHPGVEYGVFPAPGGGSTFWFALPVAE